MEPHVPVMLQEVLGILELRASRGEDCFFIDATLGGGGHSKAILEKFGNLKIVGLDRDETARELAESNLSVFGDRVRVTAANFGRLGELAAELTQLAGGLFLGVLFDLGVSNMQLTDPGRGFSYQEDGPLDMRMDRDGDSSTAAGILAAADVRELTKIFRDYGEERHAFRIASAILRSRNGGRLPVTTGELEALIRRTLPAPVQRKMGRHPARRVFQALRIAVNEELDAIETGLNGAWTLTGDGGVIIVIAYHSLEDRIVKRTFRKWAGEGMGSVENRRPLTPSEKEIEINRKARSAKLRAFIVRKNVSF